MLSVTGVTASSISLSWTASTDEVELAGYEIFRDGAKIASVGAATTTFSDETVTTNVTYSYFVRAFDTSFNRSDDSNVVEATAENRIVAVTFRVAVPSYTPADATVHVTGSAAQLGPWNAGLLAMTFDAGDSTWSRTFEMPDGTSFEWKYTRGNWETVEQWGSITGLANRGPITVSYGTDGMMLIDNTATDGPDSFRAVVDWRDPLVVGHSPADGATSVPVDSTISVEWSKAMTSASSFAVSGPDGSVAGSFALSDGDRTVTFTPSAALDYGATYQGTASGQVSADGETQQVPLSFSFSTEAAVLESITVSPAAPTLRNGARQVFTATGHYSDGSSAPLSGVTWSSSNALVLSISSTGEGHARRPGTAVVGATFEGITGQANVTVAPPRP